MVFQNPHLTKSAGQTYCPVFIIRIAPIFTRLAVRDISLVMFVNDLEKSAYKSTPWLMQTDLIKVKNDYENAWGNLNIESAMPS